MRRHIVTLFLIVVVFITVSCRSHAQQQTPRECRYASKYTSQQLISDEKLRNQFLLEMAYWEGKFLRLDGVALNHATGLTLDGHGIDYDTGLPHDPAHGFSAASKECIHVGLLALALTDNNTVATTFFKSAMTTDTASSSLGSSGSSSFHSVQDYVIDTLERKITSYENWNKKYPGFGGYLPWYSVNDQGMGLLWDWQDRIPSLDNGELIWTLAAVAISLQDVGQVQLADRYWNYFKLLADTSLMVFYEGEGKIRCVTRVVNITSAPTKDNYKSDGGEACYLDDPYEGELMAFFMDMYADWRGMNYSSNEKDKIWMLKRAKLQKATYNSREGPIDVEKGWWFSSHEKWKYMILPYNDIPINRRVFMNGEKARVHFSRDQGYGGLFASVTNVSLPGNYDPNYISATGIQEIAFQLVRTNQLVTPYGAYPLLIEEESRGFGLAWYASMLKGSKMQGPFGSTESVDMQGRYISPVITWDSKITTILAAAGGVQGLTRKILIKHGHYDRFTEIVNREWSRVFPSLRGEEKSFVPPSVNIPNILSEFAAC